MNFTVACGYNSSCYGRGLYEELASVAYTSCVMVMSVILAQMRFKCNYTEIAFSMSASTYYIPYFPDHKAHLKVLNMEVE